MNVVENAAERRRRREERVFAVKDSIKRKSRQSWRFPSISKYCPYMFS